MAQRRVKAGADLPLRACMSDRGALVCVRNDEGEAARRWRRRGPSAHMAQQGPSAKLARAVRPRPFLRPLPGVLGGVLLAAAAWLGVTGVFAHSGDSAFSRRIVAGCDALEPCQTLEAEAERRMDQCALSCGRAAAEYQAARLLRFRAEERLAVREHYRLRDDAELHERERERARQLDEWQRHEAVRASEASRERQHRLELERLRQAHVDRRLSEERQRRASYYSALGAKGRAKRLERCLSSSERCEALTLDLLDATENEAERRLLAQLNEGVAPPAPKSKPGDENPVAHPDTLEDTLAGSATGPVPSALELSPAPSS
jgi:hypothetical protein